MAEKESPVCPGVSAVNVNKHICVINSPPAKNLEGFICLQKLPQRRKTLADRGCAQRRETLRAKLHTPCEWSEQSTFKLRAVWERICFYSDHICAG